MPWSVCPHSSLLPIMPPAAPMLEPHVLREKQPKWGGVGVSPWHSLPVGIEAGSSVALRQCHLAKEGSQFILTVGVKGRNAVGKDSTHSQPTLPTFGSTSSHQPVSLLIPQRSLLLGPLGHCVILRVWFSKQLPLMPLVMSTFLSGKRRGAG